MSAGGLKNNGQKHWGGGRVGVGHALADMVLAHDSDLFGAKFLKVSNSKKTTSPETSGKKIPSDFQHS